MRMTSSSTNTNISDQGTLVRTRASEVSVLGRNTQGVTLIKVQEGEKLVQVARVAETMDEDVEDAVEQNTQESAEVSSTLDSNEVSSTTDAPEQE